MNYNSDAKFSVYKTNMTNTEYDSHKTLINCTELSIDN